MGYPDFAQVDKAARNMAIAPDGSLNRTTGLWHVLAYLRHDATNGRKRKFVFEAYDLTAACFDINGVQPPTTEDSRNTYFEPAASQGRALHDFFRHREGPRQTYLNRIQTGLSGAGPRQPKLFRTSGPTLPITVELAENWITALRENAGNRAILDEHTADLVTWLFRFGIPRQKAAPSTVCRHTGHGLLTIDLTVERSSIPQSAEQLAKVLADYLGLTTTELQKLLPRLTQCTLPTYTATEPLSPATFGQMFVHSIMDTPTQQDASLFGNPLPDQKGALQAIDTIADAFYADATTHAVGLQFAKDLARRLITSLLSKRFVILTGLSGSGKTKLAQAFARWLTPDCCPPDPFRPGALIEAATKSYTVTRADTLGIECRSPEGTRVLLPRAIIEQWADYIEANNIPETVGAKELREKVKLTGGDFSPYLERFETHYKPAAFALLKARRTPTSTRCYELVPVGADWTGNENIIGYPNGLDPATYMTTPALEVIRHALEPSCAHIPHFLILDEMNLSHVERYFADILSTIESEESLRLYDGNENAVDTWRKTTAGAAVAPLIRQLPQNLFVLGTVNVDETTYMFSPKVLDRANVIEFRIDPDELSNFLTVPGPVHLEELDGRGATEFGASFVNAAVDKNLGVPPTVKTDFEAEMKLFFELLRQHNAEFGYRVVYEAGRLIHFWDVLAKHTPESKGWFATAMDVVIVQKFLPKLHGSRSKLEGLLWALAWACGADRVERDGKDFPAQLTEAGQAQDEAKFGPEVVWSLLERKSPIDPSQAARYPLSYDKIMRMWRKLIRDQFVSFAEA